MGLPVVRATCFPISPASFVLEIVLLPESVAPPDFVGSRQRGVGRWPEEPPITVFGGSGTIFISGCNLGCAFCQNYQISQQGMGAQLSRDDFAKVCLALEAAGAENINIVTGEVKRDCSIFDAFS